LALCLLCSCAAEKYQAPAPRYKPLEYIQFTALYNQETQEVTQMAKFRVDEIPDYQESIKVEFAGKELTLEEKDIALENSLTTKNTGLEPTDIPLVWRDVDGIDYKYQFQFNTEVAPNTDQLTQNLTIDPKKPEHLKVDFTLYPKLPQSQFMMSEVICKLSPASTTPEKSQQEESGSDNAANGNDGEDENESTAATNQELYAVGNLKALFCQFPFHQLALLKSGQFNLSLRFIHKKVIFPKSQVQLIYITAFESSHHKIEIHNPLTEKKPDDSEDENEVENEDGDENENENE
jgi:hypothetical protein